MAPPPGIASPPAGGVTTSDPRRPRARRTIVRLGAVATLAVLALVSAAVIPGSHSAPPRFSVRAFAHKSSTADPLGTRVKSVFDSNVAADKYGTQIGLLENEGSNAQGQLVSDLQPLPPSDFSGPIAAYRRYAERWSAHLAAALPPLVGALRAGDRAAAQRDWGTAFADYLQLGAVYGLLPAGLNRRLAEVPPSLSDTRFPGLHRLELGLWTGQPLRSLVPVAAALGRAVASLPHTLPKVAITPLAYATRAHEILEDAQRDFMSGADVPWSGAGVLATAAGVSATREVISTLASLMQGRSNALGGSENWLGLLQAALSSTRRRDGSWPSLGQLSLTQRERIDGALTSTLGVLQEIPGTLETTEVPDIPTIAAQERSR